jgi:hypothetical protein
MYVEKAAKMMQYKKFVLKMLMKLTPGPFVRTETVAFFVHDMPHLQLFITSRHWQWINIVKFENHVKLRKIQLHCDRPLNSNLSYPILSYPILSYPILSYPILSYPILSYPILS